MAFSDFLGTQLFSATVGSFLLTTERFLLTVEFGSLFAYSLGAVLLTVRAFLLTIELLCLQWESVSKKRPQRTVSKEAQL